jgi:CRISPR-associated endonuclease/helicase Cas3
LKARSKDARFHWQDKAADLAASVRQHTFGKGAFIVNMASTGCGKTLANARIMNALAEPSQGMRCAFAIGLRTLTLQTGRSFQNDLGLNDNDLSILVGGTVSRDLFEYYEAKSEADGSASRQDLLEENSHVTFEGNDSDPVLCFLGQDKHVRKLLSAPLLVCTVDHLISATEGLRGGRQIAPMLRLMSGDLVLDEPDDFDIEDLPALTRLVYWAGLLGSRLLLSSATLPPALVEGLFLAYREGHQWFQKNRGQRPDEVPAICCLWVDEFRQTHADCGDVESFREKHQDFIVKRNEKLGMELVRRKAELLPLPNGFAMLSKKDRRTALALQFQKAALRLHKNHHSLDPHSGKRISFGLIRMANIDPLFDVAQALYQHGAPSGAHIHLCVYHSQFPLFVRSEIEYRLDTTLNRREEMAVFEQPEIRRIINACDAPDQLFVVLGSPVTEVGRDHDYDWAIVEPSSMRSLIQLAGRILRHRAHRLMHVNMLVLEKNLRHFEHSGKAAYCRPGFEQGEGIFHLETHDLHGLLEWDAQNQLPVDARPRILPRSKELQPQKNLVDLEHARLRDQMLPIAKPAPRMNRFNKKQPGKVAYELNASSFWHRKYAALTGVLQQEQKFRKEDLPYVEVVLLPNEDGDDYLLHRIAEGERKWKNLYEPVPIDAAKNARIDDAAVHGNGITPWGNVDFMKAMTQQARDMDMSPRDFAEKFATVRLPMSTEGWYWHPVLGFSVKA